MQLLCIVLGIRILGLGLGWSPQVLQEPQSHTNPENTIAVTQSILTVKKDSFLLQD